jgi:hypothetical protein
VGLVSGRPGHAHHQLTSSLVVVCLCLGDARELQVDNVRLLFLEAGRTWPWSLDDHPFQTSPVHPRLDADANALQYCAEVAWHMPEVEKNSM